MRWRMRGRKQAGGGRRREEPMKRVGGEMEKETMEVETAVLTV